MDNVPKMISTKDLDYICDMLNWNLVACKKARYFANEVMQQDIANELQTIANMHQKHYNTLLNLLK